MACFISNWKHIQAYRMYTIENATVNVSFIPIFCCQHLLWHWKQLVLVCWSVLLTARLRQQRDVDWAPAVLQQFCCLHRANCSMCSVSAHCNNPDYIYFTVILDRQLTNVIFTQTTVTQNELSVNRPMWFTR